MDSSYFFTPNLAFGAMKFTQAKVLDIAWDLCVGRGGQLALAWVQYRVFNEWVVYHMERWRTSYRMYTSVAFSTANLGMLVVLGKEWLSGRGRGWDRWWRWVAVLGMLIATVYVIAFPTLMAAMTGYITTFEPYVEDRDGNLVLWTEIREVEYMVEDSARLGDGYVQPLVAVKGDKELANAILNCEFVTKVPVRQFGLSKMKGLRRKFDVVVSNYILTFVTRLKPLLGHRIQFDHTVSQRLQLGHRRISAQHE